MNISEKELHCVARLLQGAVFGKNGNAFDGCAFCKYNCRKNNNPNPDYEKIMGKLKAITGVDLSPMKSVMMHSKFPYKKFLKNSNKEIKTYFKHYFSKI